MAAVMPPHLGGHAQVQVRHDEPTSVGRFHGINDPGHNRPIAVSSRSMRPVALNLPITKDGLGRHHVPRGFSQKPSSPRLQFRNIAATLTQFDHPSKEAIRRDIDIGATIMAPPPACE